MRDEQITFWSDGLKLDGRLFMPDEFDGSAPSPLIMVCPGFTGLCAIHPARFARYLTARGHWCMGFDYRGFAASEGERGRVLLEEQVRDIMHAAAFASADDRVDADRIVLLGWGMGAGLALDAARRLEGIAGVAAVNGFYVGERVQRAHRGDEGYRRFRAAVAAERVGRARTGEAKRGDPFEIYPLDRQSRQYVDAELRRYADYDTEGYSWELADALLGWDVEAHASRMALPLLVAHGDQNKLHPTSEARSLYDAYAGPKQLYWLEGAGHTEFMTDDDPNFQALAGRIEAWIVELVGRG